LTFDSLTGSWTLDGNALAEAAARADTMRATAGLGDMSAVVIETVNGSEQGVRAAEVAQAMGEPDVKKIATYLGRLADDGRIHRLSRGLYSGVESVESVESDSEPFHTNHTFHTPICKSCNEPMTHDNGTGYHVTCEAIS